jgi:hypothetical protein
MSSYIRPYPIRSLAKADQFYPFSQDYIISQCFSSEIRPLFWYVTRGEKYPFKLSEVLCDDCPASLLPELSLLLLIHPQVRRWSLKICPIPSLLENMVEHYIPLLYRFSQY